MGWDGMGWDGMGLSHPTRSPGSYIQEDLLKRISRRRKEIRMTKRISKTKKEFLKEKKNFE
jgi:hypothetical protein